MSTSRSAGSIGGAVVNSRDENERATIAMQMQAGMFDEGKKWAESMWRSLELNMQYMVPAANDSSVLTYEHE